MTVSLYVLRRSTAWSGSSYSGGRQQQQQDAVLLDTVTMAVLHTKVLLGQAVVCVLPSIHGGRQAAAPLQAIERQQASSSRMVWLYGILKPVTLVWIVKLTHEYVWLGIAIDCWRRVQSAAKQKCRDWVALAWQGFATGACCTSYCSDHLWWLTLDGDVSVYMSVTAPAIVKQA
jgi:hypothetical protein